MLFIAIHARIQIDGQGRILHWIGYLSSSAKPLFICPSLIIIGQVGQCKLDAASPSSSREKKSTGKKVHRSRSLQFLCGTIIGCVWLQLATIDINLEHDSVDRILTKGEWMRGTKSTRIRPATSTSVFASPVLRATYSQRRSSSSGSS